MTPIQIAAKAELRAARQEYQDAMMAGVGALTTRRYREVKARQNRAHARVRAARMAYDIAMQQTVTNDQLTDKETP